MYDRTQNQQGNYVIINGRRIPVSGSMSGRDLTRAAGEVDGRRVVKVGRGLDVEHIDPNRSYSAAELRGKDGRPAKIVSMPDRTKGGLFEGRRSALSKTLITEQVYDVALNFAKGGVEFDEQDANWLVFPKFFMPKAWGVPTAPVLLLFPTDYPTLPPIGFYLPEALRSPHGHFYNKAYHEASSAPTQKGWNWYCCYIHNGAWRPAPASQPGNWRRGDNLWTYITLINEVLNGRSE